MLLGLAVLAALVGVAMAALDLGPFADGEPGARGRREPTNAVPADAEQFRATSDCSVDITGELVGFIASVPNGSTVAFEQGGCYRIEGTVEIVDRHGLTFLGNGATFEATTRADQQRRHWKFLAGSDITIRDMTVIGAHPDAGTDDSYDAEVEGQHGFEFLGVQGVLLEQVTVQDVYGDFFYLGPGGPPGAEEVWTTDAVIRDSTFERNGRQGVAFAGAENVVIEGNTFTGVARSVFDIEPNKADGGARNVRIVDNDVTTWKSVVLTVAGKGSVSDITLADNRLHGKWLSVNLQAARIDDPDEDKSGTQRQGITIEGNRSDTASGDTVIKMVEVDGVVIRDNVQPFDADDKSLEPAVVLESCTDVVVEGNQFEGAAEVLVQSTG